VFDGAHGTVELRSAAAQLRTDRNVLTHVRYLPEAMRRDGSHEGKSQRPSEDKILILILIKYEVEVNVMTSTGETVWRWGTAARVARRGRHDSAVRYLRGVRCQREAKLDVNVNDNGNPTANAKLRSCPSTVPQCQVQGKGKELQMARSKRQPTIKELGTT
jgi:hypothetical protein